MIFCLLNYLTLGLHISIETFTQQLIKIHKIFLCLYLVMSQLSDGARDTLSRLQMKIEDCAVHGASLC